MTFSDYRTALVTGASTGIGAAVVERLTKNGLQVHAIARNAQALDELAQRTGAVPHAVDVTDTAALAEVVADLPVDVLVNNAGVSRSGNILSADEWAIDEQLAVNVGAVLHLLRLVMPGMVQRDRGHIFNVSSIAAVHNIPGNTIYHATKAAVHKATRQLRMDAFGKRVRVTEIRPGRVETEIFGRLTGDMEQADQDFYAEYDSLQPSDIADAIEYAIGTPAHVNVSSIEILPTFQVVGGIDFQRGRTAP
jgi:NADP-dependent 3-hydroxy acid dehydrogenase YdfG